MDQVWFQLSVEVPGDVSDLASGLLFELGSCGLQMEDGTSASQVRLTAYFTANKNRDKVVLAFKAGLQEQIEDMSAVSVALDDVVQQDWNAAWKVHFKPIFPLPHIAICPPWEHIEAPEGGFCLVIEPKTAFGTGHHETTRIALQMLSAVLKPGETVLDVGTGSGILSLVAAKLGASQVVGVDTDPLAKENACENMQLNQMSSDVVFLTGSAADVCGRFDVVVANIVSSVLIPMLPMLILRLKPQGRLILGGILTREKEMFLEAMVAAGLEVVQVCNEGEWMGVEGAFIQETEGRGENLRARG